MSCSHTSDIEGTMTKKQKLRRYKKETTATYYNRKQITRDQKYHFTTLDELALT